MLRTRAPLSSGASSQIPSDLHVLGLPLAFILSQDQTLHCIMCCSNPDPIKLNSIVICKKKYSLTLSYYHLAFQFHSWYRYLLLLRCIIYSLSLLRTLRLTSRIRLYVLAIAALNFQCFISASNCSPLSTFLLTPFPIFAPPSWGCKGNNLFSISQTLFFNI